MTRSVALVGEGLRFNDWDPVIERLESWGYNQKVFKDHKDMKEDYRLGIILNYNDIIPPSTLNLAKKGFILFHSSDLPQGRGWAPIYNTITRGLPLVQTMLFGEKEVDSGPMIAKARYPLDGTELENEVRHIDEKLTILLIDNCLRDVIERSIQGKSQSEKDATYWDRRYPEDSKISINRSLESVVDHLRGVPDEAPAFFEYEGRNFEVELSSFGDSEINFEREAVSIEQYY